MIPYLVVGSAILLAGWLLARSRGGRARKRPDHPLPREVVLEIDRRVPLCAKLPGPLRSRLHRKVGVFLDRVAFVPCQGARISDELRWIVAGHACLLLAGRSDDWVYDELSEILIHPRTWGREDSVSLGDGLEIREPWAGFDGESWERGPVVLSRGAIRRSLLRLDGYNVLFHEFAHQLDARDGAMTGCPVLPGGLGERWTREMADGFRRLGEADRAGVATFLDPYGAEHPSEFFAVAVEAFLELPVAFREAEPGLHAVFVEAFGFDPVAIVGRDPSGQFDS